MTYSTPELLLVGAAQNLILEGCPLGAYDEGNSVSVVEDGIEYNP